ncbi:MAG: hypothetical protein ACT4OI_11055 [Methanobacteriota archaeon]
MQIEKCEFPDDVLYDDEGLVWVRVEPSRELRLGITSIQAAVAGKLTKVIGKQTSVAYDAGRAIGAIESEKYFGPVRTPVAGALLAVNPVIVDRPKVLSESPYHDGWFARLRPTRWEEERGTLLSATAAAPVFGRQIALLKVRCFAAFPDYELFEIGTECAAVLRKLDELLRTIQVGEVVHIVSDDATAPIEMTSWSDRTRHPVVDSRVEGNLFHFLVRKAS